ncbi:sensor domain-containing diguanylate cyclase [Poseidonibacter ostreae]|jgi:diguanylate cyclase (GGDEF)-like protein|uniref:diguanylate cyclase n=2 Tax=Poseidonibacter ostreae TaxID=2654171 RepID=A0A6L4WT31_9BACT|nr:sensor domain-containing diguanylate cyclase [Poseidonibacter ostreae]KAB7889307.1 diguanylate cyclase [Poseidonibacter ostreae]KAB7892152.1 diguanylate cyclase [Poseidonibacter ostreae]MAC83534.1 GGDEF domain-containing protein [Arcobacter sp.]|tara:strand:- start:7762 stop:9210 length:1449 start_codon:yes stop_codon:yes gene_type:complete
MKKIQFNNFFYQYKILIIITLLLFIGFFTTSFFSYKIATDLAKNELKYKSLPLSSDNVYSEIQRDILKPNLVSSLMAQDTFMINWMIDGEQDIKQITTYLSTIMNKYNTSSSFLVSDKTKNYYYPKGILKEMSPNNKRDIWFYRVKNIVDEYESNIDIDLAANDSITIFTNYKVKDFNGNFLGATGVGLKTSHVSNLLKTYKEKYNHEIYLINKDNKILISSKDKQDTYSKDNFMHKVINTFNKNDLSTQEYYKNSEKYILNIRYIDELNLYLCVEAKEGYFTKELEETFYINILIFSIIILIIMVFIILYIKRQQEILKNIAKTDKLTSLQNRNNFDSIFEGLFNSKRKDEKDLTILIFDIDNFKKINDEFGHLVGDKVLIEVANIFKSTFRNSDILVRWGGDEFVALLPKIKEEKAYRLTKKLSQNINNNETLFNLLKQKITISVGLHSKKDETSKEELFSKADKNLYQAKQEGRDKIVY